MSLTGRVKDLLDEIDVRLLDHIVVSRTETVSMAAGGLAPPLDAPACFIGGLCATARGFFASRVT